MATKNYFKITAQADTVVGLKFKNMYGTSGTRRQKVDYSLDDGVTWQAFTWSAMSGSSVATSHTNYISLNSGESVLLRGVNKTGTGFNYYDNGGDEEYSTFYFTGNVVLSGNIMSLMYGDDFENNSEIPGSSTSTSVGGCFYKLFGDQTTATSSGRNYIMSAKDLILPTRTAKPYCYDSMFYMCENMVEPPQMYIETVAWGCCMWMFQGCSSLVRTPVLYPLSLSANFCFTHMFDNCSSLSNIQLYATDLGSMDNGSDYVFGNVSSNGTFVKHQYAGWDDSKIVPSGWTVTRGLPPEIVHLTVSSESTTYVDGSTHSFTSKARSVTFTIDSSSQGSITITGGKATASNNVSSFASSTGDLSLRQVTINLSQSVVNFGEQCGSIRFENAGGASVTISLDYVATEDDVITVTTTALPDNVEYDITFSITYIPGTIDDSGDDSSFNKIKNIVSSLDNPSAYISDNGSKKTFRYQFNNVEILLDSSVDPDYVFFKTFDPQDPDSGGVRFISDASFPYEVFNGVSISVSQDGTKVTLNGELVFDVEEGKQYFIQLDLCTTHLSIDVLVSYYSKYVIKNGCNYMKNNIEYSASSIDQRYSQYGYNECIVLYPKWPDSIYNKAKGIDLRRNYSIYYCWSIATDCEYPIVDTIRRYRLQEVVDLNDESKYMYIINTDRLPIKYVDYETNETVTKFVEYKHVGPLYIRYVILNRSLVPIDSYNEVCINCPMLLTAAGKTNMGSSSSDTTYLYIRDLNEDNEKYFIEPEEGSSNSNFMRLVNIFGLNYDRVKKSESIDLLPNTLVSKGGVLKPLYKIHISSADEDVKNYFTVTNGDNTIIKDGDSYIEGKLLDIIITYNDDSGATSSPTVKIGSTAGGTDIGTASDNNTWMVNDWPMRSDIYITLGLKFQNWKVVNDISNEYNEYLSITVNGRPFVAGDVYRDGTQVSINILLNDEVDGNEVEYDAVELSVTHDDSTTEYDKDDFNDAQDGSITFVAQAIHSNIEITGSVTLHEEEFVLKIRHHAGGLNASYVEEINDVLKPGSDPIAPGTSLYSPDYGEYNGFQYNGRYYSGRADTITIIAEADVLDILYSDPIINYTVTVYHRYVGETAPFNTTSKTVVENESLSVDQAKLTNNQEYVFNRNESDVSVGPVTDNNYTMDVYYDHQKYTLTIECRADSTSGTLLDSKTYILYFGTQFTPSDYSSDFTIDGYNYSTCSPNSQITANKSTFGSQYKYTAYLVYTQAPVNTYQITVVHKYNGSAFRTDSPRTFSENQTCTPSNYKITNSVEYKYKNADSAFAVTGDATVTINYDKKTYSFTIKHMYGNDVIADDTTGTLAYGTVVDPLQYKLTNNPSYVVDGCTPTTFTISDDVTNNIATIHYEITRCTLTVKHVVGSTSGPQAFSNTTHVLNYGATVDPSIYVDSTVSGGTSKAFKYSSCNTSSLTNGKIYQNSTIYIIYEAYVYNIAVSCMGYPTHGNSASYGNDVTIDADMDTSPDTVFGASVRVDVSCVELNYSNTFTLSGQVYLDGTGIDTSGYPPNANIGDNSGVEDTYTDQYSNITFKYYITNYVNGANEIYTQVGS